MKKLSFIISFVFLSILFVQAQQAKYVFYFIGDGMVKGRKAMAITSPMAALE